MKKYFYKSIIALIFTFTTLLMINIKVEAISVTYYECNKNEYKITKTGNEVVEKKIVNKVPDEYGVCDTTSKKPESDNLCCVIKGRPSSSAYACELYKATVTPINSTLEYFLYDRGSGLDKAYVCNKKTLTNCSQAGSNSTICGFSNFCSMENNQCVEHSSYQSSKTCSDINTTGGGKEECEAIEGCEWTKSYGCKGTATITQPTDTTTYRHNRTPNVPNTCEGLFGSFLGDLWDVFNSMRIIAPLLVGIFSVYEYLQVIFKKDADELKKANNRLIKRLILMAILFFLPTLVNLILHLLIGSEYSSCLG